MTKSKPGQIGMCERRVLFTALNLLLSMATSASEKSFSRRHSAMNWLQTRRIAGPLSLRKSADRLEVWA